MNVAPRTVNGISLCAGIGGIDLALGAAIPGYRTVVYCERDSSAAATLVARMEESALDPAPVWDDLTTFDGRAWRGVVDLISAGFPCQPFSAAGRRQGTDDDRWIWPDIERIIREVQPRWLVLENVPGVVAAGLGPVLRSMAVLGYDAEWGLLSASDVGAAHERRRWFCLARRRDGVDDSRGGRHRDADHEVRAGWDAALDAGGSVADASCDHGRTGERGAEAGAGPDSERRRRSASSVPHLADAMRQRCEGRGADCAPRGRHPADGPARDSRPLHAPGPANLDLWAEVLTKAPETQPSLCRMADGAAAQLEHASTRLRAVGNGVDPLQVAAAVLALADRAGWRLI